MSGNVVPSAPVSGQASDGLCCDWRSHERTVRRWHRGTPASFVVPGGDSHALAKADRRLAAGPGGWAIAASRAVNFQTGIESRHGCWP
jgi:hypothetical protein